MNLQSGFSSLKFCLVTKIEMNTMSLKTFTIVLQHNHYSPPYNVNHDFKGSLINEHQH